MHSSSASDATSQLKSLILLASDSFTSLQRTPWAGTQLAADLKSAFVKAPNQPIGESWEISCDPESPSTYLDTNGRKQSLADLISRDPVNALSPALVAAGRKHCDLLVKLINASTPLSLQIHPSDDNAFLNAKECGKPESWLILDALHGAGLYLGFAKALPLAEIEHLLKSERFTADLLQFIPVKAGDYFEIAPGVPHAVGPGIVILEPQRIELAKSGKTWRLWDWNRRYNSQGHLDMVQGQSRTLHIQESLSLLQPDKQTGEEYVKSLRREAIHFTTSSGARVAAYPANDYYQVLTIELAPGTSITLNHQSGFAGLTMLAGNVRANAVSHEAVTLLSKGQSAFVPWSALAQKIENQGSQIAKFSWIIPAGIGVAHHDGIVFEK